MSVFRRLVVEAHRRSIWQVLTVYLVGSWAALEVAEGVTQSAGLPDWVPGFALVLLIVGLPIVLATAVVQEGLPGGERGDRKQGKAEPAPAPATVRGSALASGTGSLDLPSTRPRARHRVFTWRNAVLGGMSAFTLLGIAVAAYFAMRLTGVGPVASLAAQGVFDEREPIVLADFTNSTADATLGQVVGEALRTDLQESSAVTVLPAAYIADALRRMGRSSQDGLPPEVARELALRDGLKAILQGDVGAVGSGYVLTASIVEAASGSALAAFRETAASPDELLRGIDRLSGRIREKAGESLRSIRASSPLSTVTTTSLDALRAYTQALERSTVGDREGAIRLLESAIELDPEFAMAHRKLGVELGNANSDPARTRAAITRAYELRQRLTARERLLAEAFYFDKAGADRQRAVEAYRQVLESHPDDEVALNNLATLLTASPAEREEATGLLQRAVDGAAATLVAHTNLVYRLWGLRRDSAAEALAERTVARYPASPGAAQVRLTLLNMQRRWADAHAATLETIDRFPSIALVQVNGQLQLAGQDVGLGRIEEARGHLRMAMLLSRENDLPSQYADAGGRLAWVELIAGLSPERARAALAALERTQPFDAAGLDHWTSGLLVSTSALAGDNAMAARARTAMEAANPTETRSIDYERVELWMNWATALAGGDPEAALASIDRLLRDLFGTCTGQRCWGQFERALALRAEGRPPTEIAAVLEEHMAGLPASEAFWDAVMTPRVVELLGELYEEAGDAARAAEAYARFADMWQDADAELQPRVRRARERAAAPLADRG